MIAVVKIGIWNKLPVDLSSTKAVFPFKSNHITFGLIAKFQL